MFKATDKIPWRECRQGKEAESLTLEGFEMDGEREVPAAFAILQIHTDTGMHVTVTTVKGKEKGDILRHSVALQR